MLSESPYSPRQSASLFSSLIKSRLNESGLKFLPHKNLEFRHNCHSAINFLSPPVCILPYT